MLKRLNFLRRNFSVEVLRNEGLKTIEDIPGPKGIFNMGNFYNYFKLIGTYNNSFNKL